MDSSRGSTWRQDPFLSVLLVSSCLASEAISELVRPRWGPDGAPVGSPCLQPTVSVSLCFPLVLHETSPLLALNRFKGSMFFWEVLVPRLSRCLRLPLQMPLCQVFLPCELSSPSHTELIFFQEDFRGQNHRQVRVELHGKTKQEATCPHGGPSW